MVFVTSLCVEVDSNCIQGKPEASSTFVKPHHTLLYTAYNVRRHSSAFEIGMAGGPVEKIFSSLVHKVF